MEHGLLALPDELLLAITSQLDKNSIANVRQTCKQLSGPAKSSLFERLDIHVNDKWERMLIFRDELSLLSHTKELAKEVKEVNIIINTSKPLYSNWISMICQSLHDFPAIQRLGIQYLDYFDAKRESTDQLELLRYIMWSRNDAPSPSIVRDLTITGFHTRAFTLHSGASFAVGLSRIEKLRLVLRDVVTQKLSVSEDEPNTPKGRVQIERMDMGSAYTFTKDFGPLWLAHTAPRLTRLDLEFTDYFGYFPKLDLRPVHLPKLRFLRLGKLTFASEAESDWIISHGKTLKELHLFDCPLLLGRTSSLMFDDEDYPQHGIWATFNSTSCENTHWSDHFAKFRHGLPVLREFTFSSVCSKSCNKCPDARAHWDPCASDLGILIHRYKNYNQGWYDERLAVHEVATKSLSRDASELALLFRKIGKEDRAGRIIKMYGHLEDFDVGSE